MDTPKPQQLSFLPPSLREQSARAGPLLPSLLPAPDESLLSPAAASQTSGSLQRSESVPPPKPKPKLKTATGSTPQLKRKAGRHVMLQPPASGLKRDELEDAPQRWHDALATNMSTWDQHALVNDMTHAHGAAVLVDRGAEPGSSPSLPRSLYAAAVRDVSSPETDISRTSSTSTKESHSSFETMTSSVHSAGHEHRPESKPAGAAPADAGAAPSGDETPLAASNVQLDQPVPSDASQRTATAPLSSSKEERTTLKRMHTLLELAATERNYTEDLDLLVNVFFAQLRTLSYFAEQPQRATVVKRNTEQLLALHTDFSTRLSSIVERAGFSQHVDATTADAALDRATAAAADDFCRLFLEFAPRFDVYQEFCMQHKEALAHIDSVEQRQGEWESYQLRCSTLARGRATPVPAQTGVSVARKRLLFRDFFIKPVQRLCLYPILLDTLAKYSPAESQALLTEASDAMKLATERVDQASRQRDTELHTERIAARIEMPPSFTPNSVSSLGHCLLAGNLDVLHHHPATAPLVPPLPIKYFGCFLYADFFLMVKVRKSHTYACRHWFPLAEARLSRTSAHEHWLPNGFRLTVRGHHFEMIASNAKEYELWLNALLHAIDRASRPGRPGKRADASTLPCSLPFESEVDAARPPPSSATSTASSDAKRSSSDSTTESAAEHEDDPLGMLFSSYTTSASGNDALRAFSPGPQHEVLLRQKSPPRRAAIDRGMLFSDACISARAMGDSERSVRSAVVASPFGNAVGAMISLDRLSGHETLSVRVPRSSSSDAVETEHGFFRRSFSRPRSAGSALTSGTAALDAAFAPELASSPSHLSPSASPPSTAPGSPTSATDRFSTFTFPSVDELAEPQRQTPRSRLHRRMRHAYLKRNSSMLDATELARAMEAQSLDTEAPASARSDTDEAASEASMANARGAARGSVGSAGNSSSTSLVDGTDGARHKQGFLPRSRSMLDQARSFLGNVPPRRGSTELSEEERRALVGQGPDVPSSRGGSIDGARSLRSSSPEPGGALKRSGSLNWIQINPRNWSSSSLKQRLSSRRSSIDATAPASGAGDTERAAPSETHAEPAGVHAAAQSPTSPDYSPPTQRSSSRLARRFRQQNRLSPMPLSTTHAHSEG